MLDTLEAGLQKIQTPDDEVRGMLQIAVPSDLGRNLLLTLFRDFRQRHPALRLRLLFSDQLTDVFKDPVDVAFRYGNNDDASFISLPVAPENRRVLVASPEWIARHGEPQTLEELSQHNALIYILRGRPFDRWSLSLDGVVQQQKGFRHGDERRRRGDPSAGDRRGRALPINRCSTSATICGRGACGACCRVIRGCSAVESDLSAPQTALCRGAFVI